MVNFRDKVVQRYHEVSVLGTLPNNANLIIEKRPKKFSKIINSNQTSLGTCQIDKAPKDSAKIISSVEASLETKHIKNSRRDFSEVIKPDQGSSSENKIIECDGKRFMRIKNDGHGNCLFYSLAYLKTGDANQDQFFRNEIVQYAVDNWSDVEDMLKSSSTRVQYTNVQDYATKMGSEGFLGTDFEIGNFARRFQTNVKLVILDNNKKLDESDIIPLVGSDVPNDPFIYIAFSGKRDDGHFEAMEEIQEVRKKTVEISPTNEECCETDSSKQFRTDHIKTSSSNENDKEISDDIENPDCIPHCPETTSEIPDLVGSERAQRDEEESKVHVTLDGNVSEDNEDEESENKVGNSMACKNPSVDSEPEEETDDLLNQPSESSQFEDSKNDRKSKTSNRKNWCFSVGSINVEGSRLLKNNEFDDKLFRAAIQQLKFDLNIRCPVKVFGKIRENRSYRVAYLRCAAENKKHDAKWKLDIIEYLTSNGKMFDINCSSFEKISPCPVNPGETKFSQLRYQAREKAKEELRSKSARKVYFNHVKKTDLEKYREGHTQTVRSINTFH